MSHSISQGLSFDHLNLFQLIFFNQVQCFCIIYTTFVYFPSFLYFSAYLCIMCKQFANVFFQHTFAYIFVTFLYILLHLLLLHFYILHQKKWVWRVHRNFYFLILQLFDKVFLEYISMTINDVVHVQLQRGLTAFIAKLQLLLLVFIRTCIE